MGFGPPESRAYSPKYQWEARPGPQDPRVGKYGPRPGPIPRPPVPAATAQPERTARRLRGGQSPQVLQPPSRGGEGGRGPESEKCTRAAGFRRPLQPLPSGHCAHRRCVGPRSSPPPRAPPAPPRRLREGSTSGLRGGAPAGLACSPDASFPSHFPKIQLERATDDLLWARQYTVRCYTLTSLGCAAFFCCFAVESNAVKGEVLDSGQAFPGPPGPEGVGS